MQLSIVGSGVKEGLQISLEGLEVLKSADVVLYLAVSPKKVRHFLENHQILNCEDIKNLYETGALDVANYQAIYEKILGECRQYNHVAVLLPGHPRVGVTVLQWFEKNKNENGIKLRCYPGISSFDSMVNDLCKDPLESGSVMMDINRLLLFQHPIDTTLDYYLYHICSVGTSRVHDDQASKENRIDYLKEYLLRYYDSTHEVMLLSSPSNDVDTPTIIRLPVSRLEDLLACVHFGTTLYVPAAPPKSYSKKFYDMLTEKVLS